MWEFETPKKKDSEKKIEKVKHQVRPLAKNYMMCKPDNEEIPESCRSLKHQIKDRRRIKSRV